jgi:hypothetical protein
LRRLTRSLPDLEAGGRLGHPLLFHQSVIRQAAEGQKRENESPEEDVATRRHGV